LIKITAIRGEHWDGTWNKYIHPILTLCPCLKYYIPIKANEIYNIHALSYTYLYILICMNSLWRIYSKPYEICCLVYIINIVPIGGLFARYDRFESLFFHLCSHRDTFYFIFTIFLFPSHFHHPRQQPTVGIYIFFLF